GGPLRIVDPTRYPLPGSEEAFERGVAVRGGSETVYELPRGFQWFQATAGIDPETAQSGHVLLQLFADDDLVYEHVVDGSGPLPVRVPTHGARRLTILVGHGERFDIGDYLNLGSARVTR
ncbi:MAG: NPCBM/NEW2 domain-containing protein, partial [Planctomycetota bacterium]